MKITFPHKPDGQTDRQTDGRMDIQTDKSIYRVASLLTNKDVIIHHIKPQEPHNLEILYESIQNLLIEKMNLILKSIITLYFIILGINNKKKHNEIG